MFENEEWRDINDFPHYQISNCGRVRRGATREVRKLVTSDKGFPIVTLYGADSRTRYLRQVNKLVAEMYLEPPFYSNETAVWHNDGDLSNCNFMNLKWDTRPRVIEWNEMNRSRLSRFRTPKVRNNRTGVIYDNAFECAMREGRLESDIVIRVEKQGRSSTDPAARYMYVYDDHDRVIRD